jgi:hypothetical protein
MTKSNHQINLPYKYDQIKNIISNNISFIILATSGLYAINKKTK